MRHFLSRTQANVKVFSWDVTSIHDSREDSGLVWRKFQKLWTSSAWHARASHSRAGSDWAQSLPPDPTTKFQGDNATLSLVWSSLCLWPAKPVTTGSREQSFRASFVGRPMSVESADLPPLQRLAGEVEHTEDSQMPFSNFVSEVLQGNIECLGGTTPGHNWYLCPVFCVFQIASDSPAVSSTRWTMVLNLMGGS